MYNVKGIVLARKNWRLVFIKNRSFCSVRANIKPVWGGKKATYGEKIFSNHTSSKGLVPRMQKEFSTLNGRKSNPFKNWAKDLNLHHIKEEISTSIVGSIILPPCSAKEDHVLILRTYQYVMLHGEGELRLPVKLRLVISCL